MSLSEAQLDDLKAQVTFRNDQIELLNGFITENPATSAQCIAVHGYKSGGKTLAVKKFLEKLAVTYSFVECDQSLTNRLLFQQCLQRIHQDINGAIPADEGEEPLEGPESISTFASELQAYLEKIQFSGHHVLVFDRIDQSDDHFSLMNSLIRFHEFYEIRNVSIIMISNIESPNQTITASTPHIYFQPYTEQEIVTIFQKNRFCSFDDDKLDNSPTGKQFWDTYVQVIVESFYDYTGSDIYPLIDLCVKNWPKFTETIKDGKYDVSQFIRIYRQNRDIFQDNSLSNSTVLYYDTKEIEEPGTTVSLGDMTHFAKFLLVATYLASYIDHKSDLNIFTKVKTIENIRTRRKQEVTKKDIDVKLLQASFFDLERLFAILLTIYRNESNTFQDSDKENLKDVDQIFHEVTEMDFVTKEREINTLTLATNIDVYSQLASFLSNGLLYRQVTRDILQPRSRWRCDVNWETIRIVAEDINFPLEQYLS